MKNRLDKRPDLFIHEEFNVKCFTARPLSVVRSVATHIVNALIKALCEFNKLPKLIIILPHDDLALFLCRGLEEKEAKFVFTKVLEWMVTSITRAIQSKKDALISRKPGAVIDSYPKIIWGKMLSGTTSDLQSISKSFNIALNQVLCDKLFPDGCGKRNVSGQF